MNEYAARLNEAIRAKGTPALVGIDPRLEQLPTQLVKQAQAEETNAHKAAAKAFEWFACQLIDIVAPLVPAVKPQAAFFEQLGPAGCEALQRVIRYARRKGLVVICDAKRGDIGSTATAYAKAYLAGSDPEAAVWAADALTVNPYLGADTLQPFVETARERGAGIYVLVRTSNPGAATLQDLKPDGVPVYRKVAELVEQLAEQTAGEDGFGCVGAVVGATYPKELAELRTVMPHSLLLVPGFGAQGGAAGDVAAAFRSDGLGALINSSRAINFAFRREPFAEQFGEERWQEAVEAATRKMIEELAAHTPAGLLRKQAD